MKARLASIDDAEAKRISVGGGDMDISETMAGKRERAPVEGATDSDIPTESSGRACRAGDLHLGFVAGREVVGGAAQWWHSGKKEKIDTQSRKDPAGPFV